MEKMYEGPITFISPNCKFIKILNRTSSLTKPEFTISSTHRLANPNFFYNHAEFLRWQPTGKILRFSMNDDSGPLVWIHFTIVDGEAVSLSKAPFGSFEWRSHLDRELTQDLIKQIIEHCESIGIKRILIKNFARSYHPDHYDLICNELLKEKFDISRNCRNFHIDLQHDYFKSVHPSELRRLKKAKKWQLKFEEVPGLDKSWLYDTISAWWRSRNYQVSVDKKPFLGMTTTLPDRYKIFAVFLETRIIALAVTVVVSADILYLFYPATDPGHYHLSPMVFMTFSLCNYAQKHGFKMLDLGIANSGNQELPGLIRFKKNLGALESEKTEFERILTK